jgi:hypothetical protein
MFESRPENQASISALVIALKAVSVGGILRYDDASKLVGADVRNGSRYLLSRAREIVEKETGTRFGTVTGEGVKRLDTAAVLGIGAGARRHIRRTASKTAKRLTGIAYNDLTGEQRKRLNAEAATFGAVALLATERSVTTTEKATQDTVLPAGKVLELFGKAAE